MINTQLKTITYANESAAIAEALCAGNEQSFESSLRLHAQEKICSEAIYSIAIGNYSLELSGSNTLYEPILIRIYDPTTSKPLEMIELIINPDLLEFGINSEQRGMELNTRKVLVEGKLSCNYSLFPGFPSLSLGLLQIIDEELVTNKVRIDLIKASEAGKQTIIIRVDDQKYNLIFDN